MTKRIRIDSLGAGLLLAALAAGAASAQTQGRVRGTVVDDAGKPIESVTVTVTTKATDYERVETTDGRGRFAVAFVDATLEYDFRFEKDGYEPLVLTIKPRPGSNMKQEFRLAAAGGGQGAAVDLDVDPAIEAFNAGVEAARTGDLATAKTQFLLAQKKNPKLPAVYEGLASLYLEEGNLAEAEATAGRLLELDPENTRARLVLYDLYAARGETERAAQEMEQLKTAGGGAEAAVRIFNSGASAAQSGDFATAERLFVQALELDSSLGAAKSALAFIYLNQGRHQEAIAAAQAARQLDPTQNRVIEVEYDAYVALGDSANAERVLAEMVESDPAGTAKVFFARGKALFEAGRTADAASALEDVVGVEPENARAHYMLGLCYINMGQTDKAKTHLGRFLELAPDDPEAENARQMLEYVS